MGKALIAVGTFLCVCFLIFGGVVYVSRDEDTFAVDSELSERLSKAVAEAEQMTAAAAERIGLVDHVVPKGHALDKAMEKARFLAEQAPAPMALTKQMLGEGLDRALEQERHFQSTLFLTEDFAEGRAEALGMTGPKTLEEEIAELRSSEKVDAELEAMKAALKRKGD